ncbi:hypothetical protein DICPUDRAFT_79620 [Dictyostelium purpureum]|uniref:FVYE domain-containing protein n=1 Tax=Dictyostelium purpureum TaxID=5786 RepID=F0ZN48_DICPU|nr:uncharacterized protein DICPUDRAFT_79620 [Dictyostelium purpureum]EGC34615.1 hypothetical protein DICPUDRAFT_79620 [Dictyostelium purpureum]|eukprot:XP_003288840.1 hypothetical protein DICPUDRAFT_79620 [Dictyostelium purpureum]
MDPTSANSSGVAKPDWKPDQSALQCNGCQAQFTLIRRRHHCRMCGSIFCDSCSSFYSILPAEYGYSGPQRLCRVCNNAFEQKKQFYETDALVAQFQLRSSALFEYSKPLQDIGHVKHGLRKSYCLAKNKTGDECIVSIITPTANTCPWPMTNEKKKQKFEKTLMALKHSYIMTPIKVEVSGANDKLLVIRNFCKNGSLRDLIYKAKPLSPYDTKYVFNSKKQNQSNISPKNIQKFSKQILEALLYLKSKGIQHQHLHAANVLFVNDNLVQLVDIENNLLGLRPLYYESLQHQYGGSFKENPEVVCFGHLLFEMIVGLPLNEHSNINSFIPLFPDKVFLFLQQIFSEKCPTLEELVRNSYFEVATTMEQQGLAGGKLKKSQAAFIKDTAGKYESPKASLSSSFSANNINKLSLSGGGSSSGFVSTEDRRKSMKLPSNTNLVGFNPNSSNTIHSSPTSSSAMSNVSAISSPPKPSPSMTSAAPPPPPPPSNSAPPPPPPPTKASILKDLPPKQDNRNSLLESIRNPDNFKKLKKAQPSSNKKPVLKKK